MPVSWEYIKKRREWNSEKILLMLQDRSWDNFCSFFETRDIECPSREEYNSALSKIIELETPKTKQPQQKPKTTKRASRKKRSS